MIGDGVNFASRLEGANKAFGTSILIAQRTVDLAGGKIETRPVAKLQVKGKTWPVMVYELLARAGELTPEQADAKHAFTEAFEAYLRREWSAAEEWLAALLQRQPGDRLARFTSSACANWRNSRRGPEWDGVFKLDEK